MCLPNEPARKLFSAVGSVAQRSGIRKPRQFVFGGGGHEPDEGAAKWGVSERKGWPTEGGNWVRPGVKYITKGEVWACRDLHYYMLDLGDRPTSNNP